MNRLVEGVGINDVDERTRNLDGTRTKSYALWKNMLQRCYSQKIKNIHPTYEECTCSPDWLYFSNFKRWCDNNGYSGQGDLTLDKDILIRGNKLYSENTCCFIPQRINKLILKNDAIRGKYPLGVYLHKQSGKFLSQCHDETGSPFYLGLHLTVDEAFGAYKIYKESIIKKVALEYFNDGTISEKVKNALMAYEVLITD